MKVKEIAKILEEEVPLRWQESYDNAGLVVGDPEAEVSMVLVALDATGEVIEEAIELGAQMVITHHPIIFRPIKRLAFQNRQQRTIARAIASGVALYAAHTNLDSAPCEGISHLLGRRLGLVEESLLEPSGEEGVGLGIVGVLPKPIATEEFLRRVKSELCVEALRHSVVRVDSVCRVAICSGSGGSLIESAEAAGADVYLSSDFRYHDFVDADRMILVDAGHFETEICSIDILSEILSKKIPNFAVRKSKRSENPIRYTI